MLMQLGIMAVATAVFTTVALALGEEAPALYPLVMYLLLPALGAWLSYWGVGRGLNHYAAWPISPIAITFVHWAVVGYPPSSAMAPIWAALLALVAAATGEVKRGRSARRKK